MKFLLEVIYKAKAKYNPQHPLLYKNNPKWFYLSEILVQSNLVDPEV